MINMGPQKEFQAVANHALHSCLITFATVEELLASGGSIYALSFVLERDILSI